MKGAIGFGQGEEPPYSSLLEDPSRLLRKQLELWVSQLDDSPTAEDYAGASEAIIIALECAGYPMTDLFSGHVDLLPEAEKDGGPQTGDKVLRTTIDVQRAIIRKHEDDLRDARRDLIDARAKLNRRELIVNLENQGYIS